MGNVEIAEALFEAIAGRNDRGVRSLCASNVRTRQNNGAEMDLEAFLALSKAVQAVGQGLSLRRCCAVRHRDRIRRRTCSPGHACGRTDHRHRGVVVAERQGRQDHRYQDNLDTAAAAQSDRRLGVNQGATIKIRNHRSRADRIQLAGQLYFPDRETPVVLSRRQPVTLTSRELRLAIQGYAAQNASQISLDVIPAASFITDRLNRAAELDLSLVREAERRSRAPGRPPLHPFRIDYSRGSTLHTCGQFSFGSIGRYRHPPGSDGILGGQSLPNRILMRAGEGGEHEDTRTDDLGAPPIDSRFLRSAPCQEVRRNRAGG